jgi:hypothetical protein
MSHKKQSHAINDDNVQMMNECLRDLVRMYKAATMTELALYLVLAFVFNSIYYKSFNSYQDFHPYQINSNLIQNLLTLDSGSSHSLLYNQVILNDKQSFNRTKLADLLTDAFLNFTFIDRLVNKNNFKHFKN